MKHFTAVVEINARGALSPDEIDAVLERIPPQNPVSLSISPYGYRAARITLPAADVAQAAYGAALAVTLAYRVSMDAVVSIDVMSEADADMRTGADEVPELIGVPEAAELLGVSAQRVRQMIEEGKVSAHRVGERAIALVRSEIEARRASSGR